MAMEANTTDTAAPTKGLDSTDPAQLNLMRLQLRAWQVDTRGVADAMVGATYQHHAQARAAAESERLAKVAAEVLADNVARRQRLVRADLLRAGIDHAGMTDDEVERRHATITVDFDRRQAEREAQQAAARNRERAEQLFRAARCPERHTYNLDGIDPDGCPKWAAVRDRLHERFRQARGCLVGLLGNRGTGKTEMAVSLIHMSTAAGLSARYVKAADFFREIRATYTQQPRASNHVDTEADVFDRFTKYDVLVIDEIHQRADTTAEANALTNLVDRRYDDRLVTLLIANQTKQEFSAGVGDSVVSRMHEDGETGGPIVCDWPSFRRPGAGTSPADLAPRVPKELKAAWDKRNHCPG